MLLYNDYIQLLYTYFIYIVYHLLLPMAQWNIPAYGLSHMLWSQVQMSGY